MTTVAYKDGIMAADSRWTTHGLIDNLARKIVRLKSGGLLGQSGDNDVRELVQLFDNVKTPRSLPSYAQLTAIRVDSTLLLALPNGSLFKIATSKKMTQDDDDDLGIWRIERPIAAIGSGSHLAIGAMAAGSTALAAVRIACRWDCYSGLPVYQMALKPSITEVPVLRAVA